MSGRLKEIATGSAVALVFKILAVGCSFAFNVVLARLLGAEQVGAFLLSVTTVLIAATVARAGLDNAVVKFTAASAVSGGWRRIAGLYRRSVFLVLGSSLFLASLLIVLAEPVAGLILHDKSLAWMLSYMAGAVPLVALFTLHAHFLKGLKKIKDHVLVLSLWLPGLGAIFCLLLIPVFGLRGAVFAYLGASAATLVAGIRMWLRALPVSVNEWDVFTRKELMKSALPLFWVSVFQMTIRWSPVLILGVYSTRSQVGLFSMANQTAMLMSFLLFAVNSISAPNFAELYRQDKIAEMQVVVSKVNMALLVIALPAVMGIFFFSGPIMSIFGDAFVAGAPALVVLAIGQFFNVAVGSVGFLLMMSGYESVMRNILFVSALVCVSLNLILVPIWGLMGAAVAMASTVTIQNLLAAICVRSIVGIEVFPSFSTKTRELL